MVTRRVTMITGEVTVVTMLSEVFVITTLLVTVSFTITYSSYLYFGMCPFLVQTPEEI